MEGRHCKQKSALMQDCIWLLHSRYHDVTELHPEEAGCIGPLGPPDLLNTT